MAVSCAASSRTRRTRGDDQRTTGQEILAAFADAPLDWFVAGCGTGGTVTGVGRALRRAGVQTRLAVCEPGNSPLLASGIAQSRAPDGMPDGSHPAFRPHPMQGWTPDFIAGVTAAAVSEALIDRVVPVAGADALRCARELARREGIFAGITGGATLAGALQIASGAAPGSRILALLPDTGERYQSTPLFADVPVDMTDEEIEIRARPRRDDSMPRHRRPRLRQRLRLQPQHPTQSTPRRNISSPRRLQTPAFRS